MAVTVDEASIPVAPILLGAALLSFLALRGCLYGCGRVLAYYHCRPTSPLLEHLILLTSVVLTYFCLSFNSGLSLLVCALSLCVAASLSWSMRSFRVLSVGGFAVLSLLVPLALSRGVEVVVPSCEPLCASHFAGERMRWRTALPPASFQSALTEATGACLEGPQQFIYHDHVSLRDVHGHPPALTLGHSPSWLRPLLRLSHATPPRPSGRAGTPPQEATAASRCAATRLLYSTGDHTHVLSYGTTASSLPPHMDRIALLGDDSRLEDARLRCLVSAAPASEPSSAVQAHHVGAPADVSTSLTEQRRQTCLFLTPSVRLRNVSLALFASPTNTTPTCTVHIDAAVNCSTALAQLRVSAGRACADDAIAVSTLHCLDPARELSSLESALAAVAAPAAYRQAMPVSAALRRVLPAQATKLHALLLQLMDGVVLPTGRALAKVAPVVWGWLGKLWEWILHSIHAVWPYAQQGGASLWQMTVGFVCGPAPEADFSLTDAMQTAPSTTGRNSTLASRSSSFSNTSRRTVDTFGSIAPAPATSRRPLWGGLCESESHLTSWEYAVGAQLHQSLAAAVAGTMDALELVPGVWSAYRWAWQAELKLTVWCVRGLTTVVRFVVEVLPMPVLRAGMFVLVALTRLSGVFIQLVGELLRRLSGSSLVSPARAVLRWVAEEELREMRWEWSLVTHTVASGVRVASTGLLMGCRFVTVANGVFYTLFHLYNSTSFTIHFVVVLAQSVALLVSMRDEIRALMQREDEESRRRALVEDASTLLQPAGKLARLWVRKVERHTAVTRLQGITLFVKSYYIECVRYAVFHVVIFSTLLGFSFLPFTRRLYRLTLHLVMPWYSSALFLSFRCVSGERPTRLRVLQLTLAKAVVTVVLQRTVGDLLFFFLRDIFIAVCLLGVSVLAIWAWPHRHHLVRDVAEVISDSLNSTPQRPRPSSVAPGETAVSRSPTLSPLLQPQPRANGHLSQRAEAQGHPSATETSATYGDECGLCAPDVTRAILRTADASPARDGDGSAGDRNASGDDREEAVKSAGTTGAASASLSHPHERRSANASSNSSSLLTEDDSEPVGRHTP